MTNVRKRENSLIVIENGVLRVYPLDEKLSWSIGRDSSLKIPDIKLHSLTVSRDHGELLNISGEWVYKDHKSLNGTIYNGKLMHSGFGTRIRPVTLSDGDILIFGSGKSAVICNQTVFAFFSGYTYGDGTWTVADTKGITHLTFSDGKKQAEFEKPKKGYVFQSEDGLAIYMGSVTYLFGDVSVQAS